MIEFENIENKESVDPSADFKLILELSNEILMFEKNIRKLLAESELTMKQKLNVWKMIQEIAQEERL